MEVLTRAVVVTLTPDDATVLARQLVEAIRLAYVARGRPPPRHLLDFANEVSGAARSSARFRADAQVSADRGTGEFRAGRFLPFSDQPVTLTVTEAARVAEVSAGYMRRLIRRGDVEASRGRRSAYAVSTDSLAAWLSRRRKECTQKAA